MAFANQHSFLSTIWKFRPKFVIFGATILCLLVFLLTIPLPRVDNLLIGSDGINYYVYLPSFWLDGDLDFTNNYTQLFFKNAAAQQKVLSPEKLTAIGRPANQWPVGTAVFWSPFFLLAHVLVLVFNQLGMVLDTTGTSYFYQAVVLSGSIIFGGLGLWFTYQFAQNLVNAKAALVSVLAIVFAGNIIYYMTVEPSMAHNVSLFLSSLFFCVWQQRSNQDGIGTAVLLGVIGGLMALVRPQDGLFLALPFLARLPDVWSSIRGQASKSVWRYWLRDGFAASVTAIIIYSPQLVVWGRIYGDYFRSPYTYLPEETLFFWLSPKFIATIFSSQRGLFMWHPVFFLALIGLLFLYRSHKKWAIIGFIGFFMQWYVISSWHVWVQGDAFGGRMFIVCTPIFVLGLASLFEVVRERWSWTVVYAAILLLIGWNFLLFVEYRFELVLSHQLPTWQDITYRRFTFIFEKVQELWH